MGSSATASDSRSGSVWSRSVARAENIFMSKRKPNNATAGDVTSAGIPWSEVPDYVLTKVEWMDGRHGPAREPLPSIDQVRIPAVLFTLPCLHEDRPRGSKAMIDAQGAKLRLSNCRPGAWVMSPVTGWRWAKWPTGEVGWVPANVALPESLRVGPGDDIQ
jgi:hypothetical protein